MARKPSWFLSPGENIVLAKSLAADLDSGAALTGTPTITIWQQSGGSWSDVTSSFTLSAQAVNTSALTTENGETIAIGEGVLFEITAPSATEGEYAVEVACGADDGTTPKSNVALTVSRAP